MFPGGWGSQACPRTLSLQCGGASGWYDSAINPDSNFKTVRLQGTPKQWSFICWRWDRLTREPIKERKLSFLICQIGSVARPPLPSVPPDGSGVLSVRLSVLLNLVLFLRQAVVYPRQTSNCREGENDLASWSSCSRSQVGAPPPYLRGAVSQAQNLVLLGQLWQLSCNPSPSALAFAWLRCHFVWACKLRLLDLMNRVEPNIPSSPTLAWDKAIIYIIGRHY